MWVPSAVNTGSRYIALSVSKKNLRFFGFIFLNVQLHILINLEQSYLIYVREQLLSESFLLSLIGWRKLDCEVLDLGRHTWKICVITDRLPWNFFVAIFLYLTDLLRVFTENFSCFMVKFFLFTILFKKLFSRILLP